MSYKLYTDKQEVFECKIHLEGASLTKANSRIIVETQDLKIMFEGTIDKDGNCKVPIKKLRGLLGEHDKGTMKLEVIAEDTYFLPWESDFEVGTSKKIKVEVKGQKQEKKDEWIAGKSSKPRIVVEGVKHTFDEVDSIVDTLHKKGINVNKLYESKKKMIPILKEYSNKVGYKKGIKNFITEVVKKLAKK